MGTRADFYVGRGTEAEWLGSVAFDGYPEGIGKDSPDLAKALTVEAYRAAVDALASKRRDWTDPAMGWPWPWDDSSTTDYAYAFDGGKVWRSCFGHSWIPATDGSDGDDCDSPADAVFPNMAERKNVTFGPRSGLIIIEGP